MYLRSFRDDLFRFDVSGRGLVQILYLPPAGNILEESFRSTRLEELIIRKLWPYAPVLSVARRDADAEQIRALYLELSDADWQQRVLDLGVKARKVLMVMGQTAGFRWEFNRFSADPALRSKMMLWMPPDNEYDVLSRWRACFGETSGVAEETVQRVIAVVFVDFGEPGLILSRERSSRAYTMALHLSIVGADVGLRSGHGCSNSAVGGE